MRAMDYVIREKGVSQGESFAGLLRFALIVGFTLWASGQLV